MRPKKPEAQGSKTAEIIHVEPLKRTRLHVKIRGTDQPLVINRFSEKSKIEIRSKQQQIARVGKRDKRNPEAEGEAARYVDDKGRDCIPAICLKNAIVDMASLDDNLTKTLLRRAFFVRGEPGCVVDNRPCIPIKFKKRKDAVEDVVRLAGPARPADLRYRPYYEGWELEFDVEYAEDLGVNANVLINLLSRAGFCNGLGENRPQKTGGEFGTFEVVTKADSKTQAA